MQDERLRSSLGYALVRAFRRVNRASNRGLRPLGLTAEQAHVLLILWLEGPMKVGELQRTLALSSATLTGAIDRMERAGLVRRVRDPEDGRAFVLEPGHFDARQRRAVEAALTRIEEECFSALGERGRRRLFELLELLNESLAD
jgi:DNA-binding MarR family transcriptional regulator